MYSYKICYKELSRDSVAANSIESFLYLTIIFVAWPGEEKAYAVIFKTRSHSSSTREFNDYMDTRCQVRNPRRETTNWTRQRDNEVNDSFVIDRNGYVTAFHTFTRARDKEIQNG